MLRTCFLAASSLYSLFYLVLMADIVHNSPSPQCCLGVHSKFESDTWLAEWDQYWKKYWLYPLCVADNNGRMLRIRLSKSTKHFVCIAYLYCTNGLFNLRCSKIYYYIIQLVIITCPWKLILQIYSNSCIDKFVMQTEI